jgi:hypothetical protein
MHATTDISPTEISSSNLSQCLKLAEVLKNGLNQSSPFFPYSKNPKINLRASKSRPPHTTKRSMSVTSYRQPSFFVIFSTIVHPLHFNSHRRQTGQSRNLHNHTLLTGLFCAPVLAAFFFSMMRSTSVCGLPRFAASDLAYASFARRCWGVWTCFARRGRC